MRCFKDYERNARVCILDSLSELLDRAADEYKSAGRDSVGGHWEGRTFANVESFRTALNRPWEEGLAVMESYRQMLDKQLPEPQDRRRRNRYNDGGGDLDVNRMLSGDPVMFRAPQRIRMTAPTNVALVCNTGGNGGHSSESLSWRGAATVATVDLLEAAGYSCEVWLWNYSVNQFRGSCPDWFFACRAKACGEPFDPDTLLNGMASWYFRLGNMKARQHPDFGGDSRGYGCARSVHHLMKGLDSHMDITGNVTRIDLEAPMDEYEARRMAEKVLKQAAGGETDSNFDL